MEGKVRRWESMGTGFCGDREGRGGVRVNRRYVLTSANVDWIEA